ncbi:PH domain-containing protein [Rhodococcus chondri]|uniref:PH domain-containing protein n=1 Tax=Rhodococcus chondri TaxID=3065941 RepID=A0ABU7JV88_9NOCA|nr:PH domain-containing protein [Rhodococcus sp. CC-R104]MEE2033745.1 PH domain-containing protein [Rhodococcus sp. CC-R104]
MPPPTSSHTPESTTQVIQISRLSFLACGLLFLALASPALAWPAAFAWTLIIPFLVAAWVVRVRTVVGPDGIVARSTLRTTTIGWDALKGIRFPKRGWARAALTDDSEVALPVVTFGRLPQLAAASGGRITDPYAAADEARRKEAAAERAETESETESDIDAK